MKAKDVKQAIVNSYKSGVVVVECPVPSREMSYSCGRMDALAIRTTTYHEALIGFEVKVSRADFVADKKWKRYLPYCDEFYFACPTGLIHPDEIPDYVGLAYATKSSKRGWRLNFVKKPTERQPRFAKTWLLRVIFTMAKGKAYWRNMK